MTTQTRPEANLADRALSALGLQRVKQPAAAPADPAPAPRPPVQPPAPDPAQLPPGSAEFLTFENPRLAELMRDYATVTLPVTSSSQWSEHFQRTAVSLPFFRGDNAYVWQYRGYASAEVAELKHLLTAYYVRSIDARGLLGALTEDGLFGAYAVRMDEKTAVSRDLLDSIVELYFLDRHLGLFGRKGVRILDIGAGYGRLAHRAVTACPALEKYYCTDAIPVSTFLSEYYLRFRGVADRAEVVPLTRIESVMASAGINLAINVHSFSECRLDVVDCWIGLLARHGVEHLMIVPNDGPVFRSREPDGSAQDYRHVLDRHGYEQVACQPQYLDLSLQKHGLHPSWHYLFRLRPR